MDSCLLHIKVWRSNQFTGWHFLNTAHLFLRKYFSLLQSEMSSIIPKHPETNRSRQMGPYTPETMINWMTDCLSKLAYVSFVWKLKQGDRWEISGSNLFLRQYAFTTCMSQMIIYSLLSAQNVWINSCALDCMSCNIQIQHRPRMIWDCWLTDENRGL